MARLVSIGFIAVAFVAFVAVANGITGCSSSDAPKDEKQPAKRADAGPRADDAGGGSSDRDAASGSRGNDASSPLADASPVSPVDGASDRDARANTEADTNPPDTALPPLVCQGPGSRFATRVVSHTFGDGQNNGQEHFPEWVLGPPDGAPPASTCEGATTGIVSLGNGGVVVLEFGGDAIVDGPGPDFTVFENPFAINCDPHDIFAELATVSVSDDGVTWTDFPCTATKPPYGECAGTHVVYANAKTNQIDPTDPSVSGGDPFDLADIGVSRARFVRITDRPDTTGLSGVFDLDAVAIVHPFCP